jgi:hypothetical protein
MHRITSLLGVAILLCLLSSPDLAIARQPKKYQVTGTVLEVTNDYIAVDKSGERWEIGRGAETKVTGKLEVGAKVTVEYQMSASSIDVKPADKSKK